MWFEKELSAFQKNLFNETRYNCMIFQKMFDKVIISMFLRISNRQIKYGLIIAYFFHVFRSKSPMGNGDIGGNKQDLGGPNSRPGGGNADDAPQNQVAPQQLTEEELKVYK